MASQTILGLPNAASVLDTDFFPKDSAGGITTHFNSAQLATNLSNKLLPLTGGTLTGFLTLNADPTLPLQAATKQYVDMTGGTVTSIATGAGLTGGPITSTGTISIASTAVSAGSYTNTNLTVNAQGQITSASNGTSGTVTSVGSGTGLTGGPITSSGTLSLANTAVTPGSYTAANFTVDAQGRLTFASSGISAANRKYVASNGNDANPGTITQPFATVPAAMNSITTASLSNIFLISVADGSYVGGNLNHKPFVFIEGTGITTAIVPATYQLDAAWAASSFTQLVGGINNFSLPIDYTLDFSSAFSPGVDFYITDIQDSGHTLISSTASGLSTQLNIVNTTSNGSVRIAGIIAHTYQYIPSGPVLSIDSLIGSMTTFWAFNFAPNIPNISIDATGGTQIQANFYSGGQLPPTTITGSNALVTMSASCYVVPTLISGAPAPFLIDLANGILSNHTAVNYTATNNSVEGAIAGIDNALGAVSGSGWALTGNTLAATGLLGSLNAHNVEFIYNSIPQIVLDGNAVNAQVNISTSGVYMQNGAQILNALPLANDNIFLGEGSGGSGNNMTSCLAYGSMTLVSQAASNISNMIAIGTHALHDYNSATSQTGVIVIGAGGGQAATTGQECTLIGDLVCASIADLGVKNTVIGGGGGYSTGLSDVTLIGFGVSSTANQAIVIGSGASATALNAMVFGYAATNAVANTIQMGNTSHLSFNTSAIYQQSGNDVLNTKTGTSNTFLGISGNRTTTGTGLNTGVGFNSLPALTTGHDNTTCGYNSGLLLTTGNQNTLIGSGAGKALLTNSFNVAVGYNALPANISSHSVSLGANTLHNSVGGTNVAVGYEALSLVSTSSNNVGVGFQAGQNITTGNNNIAIGDFSLQAGLGPLTGNFNVGVGNNSLLALAGAQSNNTSIGHDSGSSQTTYSQCTFLGSEADSTGNFTNAMALGYSAIVTSSNTIQLGNGAISEILANNSASLGSSTVPFGATYVKESFLIGATSGILGVQTNANTTSYNITFPNAQGAGSLTNDGSGNLTWVPASFTWNNQTSTPVNMVANNGYYTNDGATLVVLNLPTSSCPAGSILEVTNIASGGWQINQSAGQQIIYAAPGTTYLTTVGSSGFIASAQDGCALRLICTVANTTFQTLSSMGNLNIN